MAGIIVGGLWEVLVIFGVHWGITPVTVGNYAALGYDTFTGLQAAAVFSQAGAALGVFLKTKDKEMKGISASAAHYRAFWYYGACHLRREPASEKTHDLRMYCRRCGRSGRRRIPRGVLGL